MRLVLALVVGLMLLASFGAGAVAHTVEPLGCTDAETGFTMDHVDCGKDSTSNDVGQGVLHHHAGCHSHHVTAPNDFCAPAASTLTTTATRPASPRFLAGMSTDPALKPPRA